jgi:DNA-binding NarL/FixJ family response regulator
MIDESRSTKGKTWHITDANGNEFDFNFCQICSYFGFKESKLRDLYSNKGYEMEDAIQMCMNNPRAWGTTYHSGKISPNVWYTKPTKKPKSIPHYTFGKQLAMMSEKDLIKLRADLHLYGKYEVVFDLSAQGKSTKEIAEIINLSERGVLRVIKQLRKDIGCLNNGDPINRKPTRLHYQLPNMPEEYISKLHEQLDLTPKQDEVFNLLAKGKMRKEIAKLTGASIANTEKEVRKIRKKMRALDEGAWK